MAEALELVLERLERQSTGELVAAADEGEVHVFVHRGRLAWGHSTRNKFGFRAFLVARSAVSGAQFDQLVEEGLRQGSRVGEVLLKRGLVPLEVLREALARQLRGALESLARAERVVFVERTGRLAEYDPALTFSWDELKAVPVEVVRASPRASPPPPVPKPTPGLVSGLMAELPALDWAVATSRGQTHEAVPTAARAPSWASLTLEHGAWLAVLRRGEETIIGVRARFGALWGGGPRMLQLNDALAAFRARAEVCPARPPAIDGRAHVGGRYGAHLVLQGFVASEPSVLAVAVVSPDGDVSVSSKCAQVLARARQLLPAHHQVLVAEPEGAHEASRLTLADESGCWFGSRWRLRPRHSVWMVAAETLGLGLGHALVRSLAQRFHEELDRPV